jgi:hypothetical protein
MDTGQSVMKAAVALPPDSWLPGAAPDPLIRHQVASMNMLANTFMRAPGEAVGNSENQ